MPRASGYKHFLSPVAGFVTEQTPLSPIEGSTVDESNMDFSASLTTRLRRPGLSLEEGGDLVGHSDGVDPTLDIDSSTAISYAYWDAVKEDSSIAIHVFQIGKLLYFFEDLDGALSSHIKGPVIDLDDLKVSGTALSTEDTEVDMVPGRGYLLIASDAIEPHYLEYDVATEVVTANPICIFTRDLEGLDDGLKVAERPALLSDEHNYNLQNQGWGEQRRRISDNTQVDTITQFQTDVGNYPSNADISYFGMIDNGTGYLRFDGTVIEDFSFGNTEAPKGHFIVNIFNIDYEGLKNGTTSPDGVCTLVPQSSTPLAGGALGIPSDWDLTREYTPDEDIKDLDRLK